MFLFNALLYINQSPVNYTVLQHQNNFLFEPITSAPDGAEAPLFAVKEIDGELYFEDMMDEKIKEQALAEIMQFQEMRSLEMGKQRH